MLMIDLRTTADSKEAVSHQARIAEFTKENHLKLNASKLEVIKISRIGKNPERLEVTGMENETTPAAKCLGVW